MIFVGSESSGQWTTDSGGLAGIVRQPWLYAQQQSGWSLCQGVPRPGHSLCPAPEPVLPDYYE